MEEKVLIEAKNLKKYFKVGANSQLHAVDGVNFKIKRGTTLGVVGESGCGKSTLGRLLLRLYDVTDGQIIYDGTDITKLKNAPNITLEPAGEGCVRVRGWGKAGHAAMPEGTVNAIGLVVNYLLDNGLCNETERAYLEAVRKLHASTAGEGLGINCADGPFGPLTVIGGRIYMEDGRIFQTMDSRFPTCTNGKKMTEQIRAALGDGAELRDVTAAEPFYIEADSPAILACINTYNEVTGENAKPFTMGGGTYARHFPYAVSFGPEHVDLPLPEFGGPMHGANEAAPIDKLLEAVKIYIIALLRLEEIDF